MTKVILFPVLVTSRPHTLLCIALSIAEAEALVANGAIVQRCSGYHYCTASFS